MVNKTKMGEAESRFADIIWDNEPITSSELANKALELFGWKKTTSFTILKRLQDKGLFINNKGIVTSLVSKNEYFYQQSKAHIDNYFKGDLPGFMVSFLSYEKISREEIEKLKQIIDEYTEED